MPAEADNDGMTLERKLIAIGVLLVLIAGPIFVWAARSGADRAVWPALATLN